MNKNLFFGLILLLTTGLSSGLALAAEPSLHQIYQAAEAGKLDEAQTMMREVLNAHPNSGKAHYVEAELLVKQGQLQRAEAELATAERLAPGLPFAKPQAVQNLKALLGNTQGNRPIQGSLAQTTAPQPVHGNSMPWGMLFVGVGMIAFIIFAVRFMARRSATQAPVGVSPSGYPAGNAPPAYGAPTQPYGMGSMGSAGAQPGLGSRVMSGLATGAAVGAGVVAGEALMHHFMDSNAQHAQPSTTNDLGLLRQEPSFDDMGGSDFGIADSSSWDDSSGGSDWN